MKDYIRLKDMEIIHNHGFFQEEKNLGQKFIIDLKLYLDMNKVRETSDLEDTVHYGILAQYLEEIFTEETIDLIENVGDKITRRVLERFPLAEGIDLVLKKPWAPIGYLLDRPEIGLSRFWDKVYLSIGSNIGDKKKNLDLVVDKLRLDKGFRNIKVSDYIETEAWGVKDQDSFLNGAIELESYYKPGELLSIFQEIEKEIGREKSFKWGPRLIDIDILFIGDKIIYEEDLKVPHPYIEERLFVLEPLNQLAPFFIHPVSKKQIRQILEENKNKNQG